MTCDLPNTRWKGQEGRGVVRKKKKRSLEGHFMSGKRAKGGLSRDCGDDDPSLEWQKGMKYG